jgi:hypothetical protein
VPAYGEASLSDLSDSVLAALGVAAPNALALPAVDRVCLVLVDGLGWLALRAQRAAAPFLNEMADAGRPLSSPFPSSTAVSVTSLGTALPPGQHGVTGYTMALPGLAATPMNCIGWNEFGVGGDLRDRFPPEQVQPNATVAERLLAAGKSVVALGPRGHIGSGLSRAALRGARHVSVETPAELVDVAPREAARLDAGGLLYAYIWQLDLAGHVNGTESIVWQRALADLDRCIERLASALASHNTLLVITGDHGMIDVPDAGKIEARSDRQLMAGVRLLAGEPRARHVHALDGRAQEVLATWGQRFGDRAWVASRDEAIEAGWFGPIVTDAARQRIGDVVVAARDRIGIFQRRLAPREWKMVGHHGSMTPDEQLVPLLLQLP